MGEAFLTRRGGGAASGGVKGAVIGVIFPVGASVNVSNGTKTYTSKDTDGNAAFSVEAGTWTVTSALGEDSTSKNVTVKDGDWTSVELNFWNGEIYFRGNEYSSVTGGIEKYPFTRQHAAGYGLGTLTKNADNITLNVTGCDVAASPVNKIDLSSFSVLKANITANNAPTGRAELFVWSSRDTWAASVDIGGATGEVSLDVSQFNGEYYVGLGVFAAASVSYSVSFDELRLR